MRKPEPNFVVEYKAGRRQKRSSKTSIWGSVDLTSLVKEIEGDLPTEIGAPGGVDSDEIDQGSVVLDQNLEYDNREAEVEASLPVAGRLPDDDGSSSSGQTAEVAAAGSSASDIPAAQRSAREAGQSPGARSDTNTQRANLASKRPETLPASSPERISRQALAVLEVENVQLKAQLAQRLAMENCRLKKMLERFVK